ncbi:MAG: hypothetical protein FJZ90_19300 [Chloroflexi bacterium]|nr:hypothetical protein [Chloroflexota bacterium]
MSVFSEDKTVLRELAAKLAELAALPVQREKKAMWQRHNRLEPGKPMVSFAHGHVPWHEMNVDDELTLRTKDPFCRDLELSLRQTLYEWEHMRCDMFVEPVIACPFVVHDTGFGIDEDVDVVKTDERNTVVSRHFHRQIATEDDLEKIRMPQVTYDEAATEANYERMLDIFQDILPVEKRGRAWFWFAPWDELIRWYTIQAAMEDMVLNPKLVHKAIDRLVRAYLCRLDQYEALNLLATAGASHTFATDELPRPGADSAHVRPADLWGRGAAQIFSDVSPQMHWEFALQYEVRWFERFGLNHYGCCDPLHRKVDLVSRIPNLRKIAMSPWVDLDEGAERIGNRYVFSWKPNPAILATDSWDREAARADLVNGLEKTVSRGCIVEIIMQDTSTVRYQPQRFWEWAEIACEVTGDYA